MHNLVCPWCKELQTPPKVVPIQVGYQVIPVTCKDCTKVFYVEIYIQTSSSVTITNEQADRMKIVHNKLNQAREHLDEHLDAKEELAETIEKFLRINREQNELLRNVKGTLQ